MAVYSFLNVVATITGPGGNVPLGSGNANAEEGITTSMKEEKNLAHVGADGALMQVLRATRLGKITIRLLKTSSQNALLSLMYNFQRQNPAAWAQNQITILDSQRGDVVSGSQMAFVKMPDITWDRDGKTVEWEFEGNIEQQLGTGAPNVPN